MENAKEVSMKKSVFAVLIAAVSSAFVAAQAADAGVTRLADVGQHVVFVQSNETTGNRILVYWRADNGTLSAAGTYATGGSGGVALPGTESDHLASQGSLVYDANHSLLFAVNAGSNTFSVFHVDGKRLTLQQVVPSGGSFPASIAVHGDLVYVLNASESGVLAGFRIAGSTVQPIAGSTRSLGLTNSTPPNFLTSPGQIGFTPDGRSLVATTKASGSSIDVFAVGGDGRLSAAPVVNASATPVPFAFTFDPISGRLVSGEAGAGTLSTYVVGPGGTLSNPRSLADGQVALCWVTRVRSFYYVSNTGSSTVSGYRIGADGQPALLTADGVVAATEAGPIDSASSGDRFLYVETGIAGTVDEFRVGGNGTLTRIGTVTDLPQGIEGIAAS
jgi:6-phosphogluconolactonase (cycloisomerase 2 family)